MSVQTHLFPLQCHPLLCISTNSCIATNRTKKWSSLIWYTTCGFALCKSFGCHKTGNRNVKAERKGWEFTSVLSTHETTHKKIHKKSKTILEITSGNWNKSMSGRKVLRHALYQTLYGNYVFLFCVSLGRFWNLPIWHVAKFIMKL